MSFSCLPARTAKPGFLTSARPANPLKRSTGCATAGISTAVTKWLDGLNAAGQKPVLTVLVSIGVSAVTARSIVKLLSSRMTGLLRHDRPHRRGVRQAWRSFSRTGPSSGSPRSGKWCRPRGWVVMLSMIDWAVLTIWALSA